MNTTDPVLKEMYDAFQKLDTNKKKVKFLKDHRDSGIYKSYDIKWDNLIKTWSSKDPLAYWRPTVKVEDENENKEGTKDTLDN
tara:strand:+ start:111 stop:359 length:249 start_codon:yes stop_codon:yes gene_type:complete